jgi:hypothetical protein
MLMTILIRFLLLLATLTVDKAAAHRFVKASLATNPDQKRKANPSDESEGEESEEETKANDKARTDKGNAQAPNKRRRGVDPFTGMSTRAFPSSSTHDLIINIPISRQEII